MRLNVYPPWEWELQRLHSKHRFVPVLEVQQAFRVEQDRAISRTIALQQTVQVAQVSG